jgi:hypothetical protein
MPEQTIMVIIQSPQGQGEFTFAKTIKVSEAIELARTRFGYEPGSFVLKQDKGNKSLALERPLVSYHIESGELLLLVPEMGQGV